MAMSVGVLAIRRIALRSFASGESSHPSGSYAGAAETLVRSIDIGEVCCARVGMSSARKRDTSRSPTSRSFSSSSSASVGSRRLCRRYTTSSKVERAASSWMSYPTYQSRPARPSTSDSRVDAATTSSRPLSVMAAPIGGILTLGYPFGARCAERTAGASPRWSAPGGPGRAPPGTRWSGTSAARIDTMGRNLTGSEVMSHRVTLIPGDGVGPELSEATRRVLEATGVEFDWDVQEAGADVVDRYGTPLPEPVLASIRETRVAIKGPITTPVGSGFRSVNVALRKELDLYACLRPCKWYPGVRSRYEGVDIVIVRENTEDLYAGIEFEHGTP